MIIFIIVLVLFLIFATDLFSFLLLCPLLIIWIFRKPLASLVKSVWNMTKTFFIKVRNACIAGNNKAKNRRNTNADTSNISATQPPTKTYMHYHQPNPLMPHIPTITTYEKPYISSELERFMIECNAYVAKQEEREDYRKNYGISSNSDKSNEVFRSNITKTPSTNNISSFKKSMRSYNYKDSQIEQYSNSVCTYSDVDASQLADINARDYHEYLCQIAHIYIDYGFVTAKMAAYGCDIPLKYGLAFVLYLFGKELPESKSAISNDTLESVAGIINSIPKPGKLVMDT